MILEICEVWIEFHAFMLEGLRGIRAAYLYYKIIFVTARSEPLSRLGQYTHYTHVCHFQSSSIYGTISAHHVKYDAPSTCPLAVESPYTPSAAPPT